MYLKEAMIGLNFMAVWRSGEYRLVIFTSFLIKLEFTIDENEGISFEKPVINM